MRFISASGARSRGHVGSEPSWKTRAPPEGGENSSFTHALYRACDAITTMRAITAVTAFLRWEPVDEQLEVFPRVSANDLRRTFGTWLRAHGVPSRSLPR